MDDQVASLLTRIRLGQAEDRSQVDDRGDVAAEVDDPADILRRMRHLSNLGLTIDLLDDLDVDAQQHVADVERGELQFGGRTESFGGGGGGGGHGLVRPRKTLIETVDVVGEALTLSRLQVKAVASRLSASEIVECG